MTKERRENVILLALAVSIALHVGLMFFVKPEVMVHVDSRSRRAVRREPMRAVKAPADAPRPVSLDELLDLKPLREAPKAEALAVREPAVPSAASSVPAPKPTVPVSEPSAPAPEVAHFEQDAISLDEVVTRRIELPQLDVLRPTDVADAPKLGRIAAAPKGAVAPPVRETAAAPSAARVPTPILPMRAPAVVEPASEFRPTAEVYEKVDERVVEAEKAAVKRLIGSTDAVELAPVANATLLVERRGGWLYFKIMMTPRHELRTIPKDVVVLIDASGSIGKDRMGSIRKAAKNLLRSATNTGDRFNLVAFRDRYSYAFRQWQFCTRSSFDASDRWLNEVVPYGRTDVFSTISSVLTLPRDPVRPMIALVVTDGEANVGVTDTSEILSRFTQLNDGLVSVYMYGVKSSANRELIDMLTHCNRGESFVFDGWRWNAGEGIDGLSMRFRDPVLSDLRLVFPSSVRADTYPVTLRNLYRGETLEIYGRVAGNAEKIAFSLRGQNAGKAYEGFFSLPVSTASASAGVADGWAREHAIAGRLASR